MDPAFEVALEWAKSMGVPIDQLGKAKGMEDVHDVYKQWVKEKKEIRIDELREMHGLPSLRDARAHGSI